uniref:Immunoglobulin V-set domain-containing protein n=1 Tax=Lates calcarifer TaxID=8187 RepID=A0A4W6BRG0_LATCA
MKSCALHVHCKCCSLLQTNRCCSTELLKYTEVSCVFMESCILPCSFQSGADPVIHWILVTAGKLPVHSFYFNQDQLRLQNQFFRNRTSLFKDQISRGNASLQLTGVEDQGRYRCYTSTMRGNKDSFVNLQVDGMRDTQEIHKTTCLCFLCVQYSVNVVSNSSQSSSFLAAPVKLFEFKMYFMN